MASLALGITALAGAAGAAAAAGSAGSAVATGVAEAAGVGAETAATLVDGVVQGDVVSQITEMAVPQGINNVPDCN